MTKTRTTRSMGVSLPILADNIKESIKRTTRSMGVSLPILADNINDNIKESIKPKKSIEAPGTEYVSNFTIGDCESDNDGLKGEVFAQFVYNKLKNIEPEEYVSSIPQVFIMIGPPGAGKSTIKRQFNIKNYINIDLDEIKKILQKCFPNDRAIRGFGIINQLKRLAKYLLDLAIRENMNILFDTTGRMKELVTEVIDKTSDSNYEIQLIAVNTSRENCLQRAEMRNKVEPDREPMEPFMVNGAYDSFMEKSVEKGTLSYYLMANPELLSRITQLYIFDNNGPSPELLFKKVGDNVEISQNYPNLYNMSINSSPPYFSLKSKGGKIKTKRIKIKTRKL